MAPSFLSLLALASSAAAVPYFGHGHQRHARLHHTPAGYAAGSGSVVAPAGTGATAPYLPANGSSIAAPPGASGTGASGSVATGYETEYKTNYATVTSYVSHVVQPSGSDVPVDAAETSSSSCTSSDVTISTKVKTTIYITPSGYSPSSTEAAPVSESAESAESTSASASSSSEVESSATLPANSAPASSSSEASPVESSVAPPAYSAPAVSSSSEAARIESSAAPPAYTQAPSSSIEAAPVETSSAPAPPAYTSEAAPSTTSVEVAPAAETATSSTVVESSAPAAYVSTTSSAAAEASSPPSYSGGGGLTSKRGLSYNDVSLLQCLADGGNMGWAYNWASSTFDGELPSGLEYIPTLWGTSEEFTGVWNENAQAAIDSGSGYLFSFNEPDMSTQANMAVSDAAAGYKEYMMPFAGKAKLGSPSVTNGGGEMGLTYLQNFLDACDGCQVDFVNIHWYDSYQNAENFKDHVRNASEIAGGKPVFVSEFGCIDGSDADISSFLEEVIPFLEGEPSVEGYAYFMASEGILNSGSEPSAIGQTYATTN